MHRSSRSRNFTSHPTHCQQQQLLRSSPLCSSSPPCTPRKTTSPCPSARGSTPRSRGGTTPSDTPRCRTPPSPRTIRRRRRSTLARSGPLRRARRRPRPLRWRRDDGGARCCRCRCRCCCWRARFVDGRAGAVSVLARKGGSWLLRRRRRVSAGRGRW